MRESRETLTLQGVGKTYALPGSTLEVLSGVDLEVQPGEFVVLVGQSGCGKSTLLRLIAGLEAPSAGEVRLGGRRIQGPGLERGVVFQEPRLFPWMTARENVAFGLKGGGTGREAEGTVREYLELVGLSGFGDAYPHQLSGGMQQRAAMARALVSHPQVLLLDEPFGALDALTRIQMQEEILRIGREGKGTLVLVTHDIDEAVFLGDRVVVLSERPGRVREIVRVPLKRPRDRNSTAFGRLRREIYGRFFGKARP